MGQLSKSDFKVASDCITKLYYKKKEYPSANEENDYLSFLADGGHQVGKLATMQYPHGIDINTGNNHKEAVRLTEHYLKRENVTLFEPSIQSNNKLVRIDILDKVGKHYQLIEVKSKSFNSAAERKEQVKSLKKYIEDVAFQYYVLKEWLDANGEGHVINAYLFLPDKSKRCKMEGMNSSFRLTEAAYSNKKFRAVDVEVTPDKEADILKEDILTLFDVTAEVMNMQKEIAAMSKKYLGTLNPALKREQQTLTKACFKCEYTSTSDKVKESGFDLCWRGKQNPEHHIRNLYHSGTLGNKDLPEQELVNHMISINQLSMFDVPDDYIGDGSRGLRQRVQLDNTRENSEWFSEGMKEALEQDWEYPLHFIDFETATAALPYHKGMRPYEAVAFQWSCHTIYKPGDEPVHNEWINVKPEFPNFEFARTLKAQIDGPGTVLMWSHHENTILKNIYSQLDVYDVVDPELKNWLGKIAKIEKGDKGELIDMNAFTLEHYFHPFMKGRTSIKVVLPAVLLENSSERMEQWLTNFQPGTSILKKEDGKIIDPYKQLPYFEIFDKGEQLKDGGGAMSAYQDILFGAHMDDMDTIDTYRKALLNYCKLDTLAMVIIWEHWRVKLGLQ